MISFSCFSQLCWFYTQSLILIFIVNAFNIYQSMKGEFGTHNRSLNNCDCTQLEYLFPQTILIFNIIIFQYFQGMSKSHMAFLV